MRAHQRTAAFASSSVSRSANTRSAAAAAHGRRDLLASLALAAPALAAAAPPALAAKKGMKGFNTLRDTGDGYELIYPFGWQEVSVNGVDAVFKDVIEPLENCAVQLVPTEKKSIAEYGKANEIAGTLARSVLTSGNDEIQLIKSEDERDGDRDYVTFEFLQKSQRFTRHVLATATVANGQLMLFTIGAGEKRWPKIKDRLTQSVQSFKGFERY